MGPRPPRGIASEKEFSYRYIFKLDKKPRTSAIDVTESRLSKMPEKNGNPVAPRLEMGR